MLNNLKNLFEYSKLSTKFLKENSKRYLILNLLMILISSIQVFPSMYLVSYSLDLLMRKVELSEYIREISIIIILISVLSIAHLLIKNHMEYVKKVLYTKIRTDINDICMNTDYTNVQSKTFLEKKDFALAVLDNDSLDLFIQSMNNLLSCILVMSGVLYIISTLSLVILIPLIISLAISLYNDYLNARQNFIDTKDEIEYGRKSSYLHSISCNFTFAKEIRMFNLKGGFNNRMNEVDQLLFKMRENRRRRRRPSGLLAYSSETVLEIASYLYFGYQVIITNSITVGQFSLYSNALRQLKNSVDNIIFIITEFIVNTEYLKGFFDFMKLKQEDLTCLEKVRLEKEAEIKFEDVSFRYPNSDHDVLKNINITIKAGETLLIVGENGAGKSTFVKLLCGLYRPTKGRILFNGVDISLLDYNYYVRQISAVFQDYTLFAMSIAENICALDRADTVDIDNALKQVNLFDKVYKTALQTDTQLYRIFDDTGVEFSGGEMQRLAIARAIYKNTPILILDEPTSALDPKSEYEIYSSFHSISKNRTSIYISHRLSSIKFSDKIAVFQKGEIVEYGSHENLMEKQGIYKDLYSMQANLYCKEV